MAELQKIEDSKKRIELKGRAKEFVFGIQDGLISILGLITGVYGAFGDHPKTVVIVGITGAIAAALSMAAGSLLSSEAERDLLLAEIQKARSDFEEEPYLAQQSIMLELEEGGLDKPTAYQVVNLLSKRESTLFSNFRSTVLDLPGIEEENPVQNAIIMFVAFILGSLFPIIPFIVTSGQTAYLLSLVTTGGALFAMGSIKGYFSKQSIIKSGLKFFVIAVAAGVISEFMGSLISLNI